MQNDQKAPHKTVEITIPERITIITDNKRTREEADEENDVDDEEIDEDENEDVDEDDDGYDSAENCWRCRDDMCFKHAARGLGITLTPIPGSGGTGFSLSFPRPPSPTLSVPNNELQFNDAGPPDDGIPVRFSSPQDQYILKKFLKHNSNKHPPTRVKQDSDGTKFRVYCYPGNVVHLMQEWTAEWESLPANKK